MQELTFVKAVMEYFGRKPGQTAGEMLAELKQLTEEDRNYFIELFKTVNIKIVAKG